MGRASCDCGCHGPRPNQCQPVGRGFTRYEQTWTLARTEACQHGSLASTRFAPTQQRDATLACLTRLHQAARTMALALEQTTPTNATLWRAALELAPVADCAVATTVPADAAAGLQLDQIRAQLTLGKLDAARVALDQLSVTAGEAHHSATLLLSARVGWAR